VDGKRFLRLWIAAVSASSQYTSASGRRPGLRSHMLTVEIKAGKTEHVRAIRGHVRRLQFSQHLMSGMPIKVASPHGNRRIRRRDGGQKRGSGRRFAAVMTCFQQIRLEPARSDHARDAAKAQVFSDVDSAYATLKSNVILLHPYKEKYLAQAVRVRDTIAFSYQHGGASLLDFLSAQSEYRTVQLAYVNLIGSYLSAASQLNLAVGREVIP